jgi:hypothetical protein
MAATSALPEVAPAAVTPILTASLRRRDHLPTYEKIQRIVYAIGILFPAVGFAVIRAFAAPIKAGAAAQMAYSVAHPALHQVEQIIVPLASVLSLLGVIGLVQLAIRRSPRLALTGGALALAGWGTLPIWAGQDNLTYLMGKLGSNHQLVELWNQFNTSGTNTYLYIFIIGHLVGPLLLAIALRRGRLIPQWSPIVIAATIPLHILTFATGARYFDPIAYAMLAGALTPAVIAVLKQPPHAFPAQTPNPAYN